MKTIKRILQKWLNRWREKRIQRKIRIVQELMQDINVRMYQYGWRRPKRRRFFKSFATHSEFREQFLEVLKEQNS